MNNIDRSSDNWYEGGDSDKISCPPDIYFDEENGIIDAKIKKLLWTFCQLKDYEFRIIRYRVNHPKWSLDKIADAEVENKSSILKKIHNMCKDNPVFSIMFRRYIHNKTGEQNGGRNQSENRADYCGEPEQNTGGDKDTGNAEVRGNQTN